MKIKNGLNLFLLSLTLVSSISFAGGFSLGKSRVVVTEGGGSVKVLNTGAADFLVQSWVSFYKEDDSRKYEGKVPFVVTPPLYRQSSGSNLVKITPLGTNIPGDRESVFYFNAKAIPKVAGSTSGDNKISFSYTMTIKLFYRPKGLSGNAPDAYKQLLFTRENNAVMVKNPTPYYITFNKIAVGGDAIKNIKEMVPPLGTQTYDLPSNLSGNLTYETINEYGGITPQVSVHI